MLLATGSAEWTPPGVQVDGERVLTSREALESKRVPERLRGDRRRRGGRRVRLRLRHVRRARDPDRDGRRRCCPGADPEVAAALQREFRRKGIEVRLGTRFEELKQDASGVRVAVQRTKGSEELARRPGARRDRAPARSRPTSASRRRASRSTPRASCAWTRSSARSAPTISAIGDLAGAPLLAHKASEEGIAAVEWLAGVTRPALDPHQDPRLHLRAAPGGVDRPHRGRGARSTTATTCASAASRSRRRARRSPRRTRRASRRSSPSRATARSSARTWWAPARRS